MERSSDPSSVHSAEGTGGRKRRQVASEDAGEVRRRRKERMDEVRRTTRSERLKRLEVEPTTFQEPPSSCSLPFSTAADEMESLCSIISGVWSGNSTSELDATKQFRECFLMGSPSIEKVIKAASILRFLEFLQKEDCPELQVEAAWALTGFISNKSERTEKLLSLEAVHGFVKLLGSPNSDVREQALWALGNIAWESPAGRDLILNQEVLSQFFAQLGEESDLSIQRTASWALANFFRADPPPRFEQVRSALSALDRLLQSNDQEILTDACWALYNILHGFSDKFDTIIDSGVCHRLVEVMGHSSPPLLNLVVMLFTKIASLEDFGCEVHDILKNGGLKYFRSFLTYDDGNSIQKKHCLDVLGILCRFYDTQGYIEADLIQPLTGLLQHADKMIKREAVRLLTMVIGKGNNDQRRYIGRQGCIRAFVNAFTVNDGVIISDCLTALEDFLMVGQSDKISGKYGDENGFLEMLRNAGGIDKLTSLKSHPKGYIRSKAQDILKKFYFTEKEDEDGKKEEDEAECSSV